MLQSFAIFIRAKTYGWQDTYVFTKAMGEMMIDKLREEIPVVIVRPSVIESTYKEPFPGWMEGNRYFLFNTCINLYNAIALIQHELTLPPLSHRMMDPIILYYGKGQLTGFLVDPNGVLDVVSKHFDF